MSIFYKEGLSLSKVSEVEEKVGRKMPEDYKDFLGRMNGFYLTSPHFTEIKLNAVPDGVIAFDRFFGFLPAEESNDIVSFNHEFINELDYLPNAIAIGEDGGGNPYVILNKGRVYYWDRTHLHEGDTLRDCDIAEQNGSGNLYFIAKNFEGFLEIIIKSFEVSADFVKEE